MARYLPGKAIILSLVLDTLDSSNMLGSLGTPSIDPRTVCSIGSGYLCGEVVSWRELRQ